MSSFDQVVLLDSDNLPLLEPAQLLAEQRFQKSGNLFWRDYFQRTGWNVVPPEGTVTGHFLMFCTCSLVSAMSHASQAHLILLVQGAFLEPEQEARNACNQSTTPLEKPCRVA